MFFFGLNRFGTTEEKVSLPQNDVRNSSKRQHEIKEAKDYYNWSHEAFGDCAMIEGVPRAEIPSMTWVEGILKTVFRIILNGIAVKMDAASDSFGAAKAQLLFKIGSMIASAFQAVTLGLFDESRIQNFLDDIGGLFEAEVEGKGGCLQEYKDLFQVYPLDKVARLDQCLRDDIFGWYRVAGPSPMHLSKFDKKLRDIFPEFTDAILQGIPKFGKDTTEEIIAENRLFWVDYPEFDGCPTGEFPDGSPKEGFHLYAPTCLLAVPKKAECDERTSILPIAIRCAQQKDYPMYTPNPKHTDEVTWLAAKTTVQVADAVMHETRYHLGRTHLLLECFICALHRTLAPTHPLFKFMTIHFEGTAFINYIASLRLVSKGGTIDMITAPPIEKTTDLCAAAIRPPFSFNESVPDKEMANRGVLDADHLKYPFRDDSIKLWNVIRDWVRVFVTAYYKSDKDVQEDSELQAWGREIVAAEGGGVPGFGEASDGSIKTVNYLVQFTAQLVYIGSVQHSALNFPQGTHMQFVPAMPVVGFAPAPKTAKPYKDIDDWVSNMLPDLKVAQRQLNTMELLAALQYTTLGEYGRDLNFAPDEVDDSVKEFKERLGEIGGEIQKRNTLERKAGLPVYDFLVPKNIPQSTNV